MTSLPFMKFHKMAYGLSGILFLLLGATFSLWWLNYGIDFQGGILMEASFPKDVNLADTRRTLGKVVSEDLQIQNFGNPQTILIRVEAPKAATPQEAGQQNQSLVQEIKEALGEGATWRRTEVVGPRVSGELVNKGILAVLGALGMVLVYVWLRFEWQFAIGAIVALAHDVALTIGVFSLTAIEFNLSIIAALLTIIGYSLNDTVVIYDRIRENLQRYKKMPIAELVDKSLNSTLRRTLMTSLTTLVALFALYLLGGEVLRGFTFAMIWGVIIGTYSSLFIASPLLLSLNIRPSQKNTEQ